MSVFAARENMRRAEVLTSGFGQIAKESHGGPQAEPRVWYPRPIQSLLVFAGYDGAYVRGAVARFVVVSVVSAGIAIIASSSLPLLLIVLPVAGEYLHLTSRATKRSQSFEKDFAALLISTASGVRAGVDPVEAISNARLLFSEKSEIRGELERFRSSLERGATSEEAIVRFGETIDHPDIQLFATALLVSHREGASLAESLQRLVRVVRQRQSFRRKIKSAVAMQRLSAIGIGLAFAAIMVTQLIMQRDAVMQAWADPLASKVLVASLLLLLGGLYWMHRLAKPRL